jgi:hypothetical protein
MIERPDTMEERIAVADAAAANQEVVAAADDLPRKHTHVTTDGNTIIFHATRRYLRAYTNQFEENLGLSLRKWSLADVPGNLQKCFPTCDALDCDYLEDVVRKLQLTPRWGQNGVTSGPGERFTENARQTTRWISQQRAQLREIA